MKIFAETERLILREIVLDDAEAMFEMDSDPEVFKHLGKSPVQSIQEVEDYILSIRKDYEAYGIGRWALTDKATGSFIGWSGLKFRTQTVNQYSGYHEVGYRLLRRFWGKGYATESARAAVDYGFEILRLESVFAMTNRENIASRNALLKTGLKITAEINFLGTPSYWFEITKEDWLSNRKTT